MAADKPPTVEEEEATRRVAVAGFDRQTGKFWKHILLEDDDPLPDDFPAGSPESVKLKKELSQKQFSLSRVKQGRNHYPFNPYGIHQSIVANPYHQTCLSAKVNATVGVGFLSDEERKSGPASLNSPAVPGNQDPEDALKAALINPFYLPSKVDDVLSPLCEVSWQDTLLSLGHDFFRSGNAFLEVSREKGKPYDGKITGLWHLPWFEINAYVESMINLRNWHWIMDSYNDFKVDADTSPGDVRYARFGDKEDFLKRVLTPDARSMIEDNADSLGLGVGVDITDAIGSTTPFRDPDNVHEIIHIRNPYAMHRIYGFPDWLSAIPSIEMIQALMQYKLDFFVNRGVPEFMLFITGQKLSKPDWDKVEQCLQDSTGITNSHKSFALNLEATEVEITVEKFDQTQKDQLFQEKQGYEADIVTGHRVPPLLANILIPGKLGATNEFPNALMSFQVLTINTYQRIFQQTLAATLGDNAKSGLGLNSKDFILRKITDLINVGAADTVGRMKETVTEAKAKGRDLNKGVKD